MRQFVCMCFVVVAKMVFICKIFCKFGEHFIVLMDKRERSSPMFIVK